MSDLRNFKSNDEFKEQLKKFLLTKRNISIPNKHTPPVVVHERFSFDLKEDLISITEAKLQLSNQILKENMNANEMTEDSFMTLERICDKTASDPNSTLFEYLHSDCKDKVLENAMKRHSDAQQEEQQTEMVALEQHCLAAVEDVTQIENIEAPSRFWENSMLVTDSVFTTSPVKMVGLLRPSTIVEADDEDLTIMSKAATHSAGTSYYETASDATTSTQAKTAEQFYSPTNSVSSQREPPTAANMLSTENSLLDGEDDDDESVVEILSDSEDKLNMSSIDDSLQSDLSDLMDFSSSMNSTFDMSNKENVSENNDASRIFNDTLEQVEYMMQKGLEIMADEATQHVKPNAVKEISKMSELRKPERVLSPRNPNTPLRTPIAVKKDYERMQTESAKKRFGLDVKPMPKLDIFKKPLNSATKSHSPAHSSHQLRNPRNFDHIMSPVGMYIKNTANTPLMSHIRNKQSDQLHQMLPFTDLPKCTELFANPTTQTKFFLPKKAYISSNLKHVVDERANIKVPGGQKIHKYVDDCMIPAVIKHDGKMHLNTGDKRTAQPQNCNDSLKDLSMMSGDVSLLTIKDARKF